LKDASFLEKIIFINMDDKFIRRCFDLAQLGINSVSPNPSVGAVIVDKAQRIIGEGWTSPYGGPHGEVNAVASVKPEDRHLLASSTLFVSLEPCFHFGKTPPCVDLILREKIPHVVIAFSDPFPKVAGKSIQKLKENGVKVDILSLDRAPQYAPSLLPFFTNVSKKRPYIILKWAETADGFIGNPDTTLPISNAYAKRLVHKWRSESDAIMVGTNTAALDNPELTNRLYFGPSPMRVVLDRHQRLPSQLNIFDKSVKTRIYMDGASQGNREKSIYTEGPFFQPFVTYCPITFDEHFLESILEDLQNQKIGTLFVEGGAQLLNTFIQKGLWDEARVFKTPTVLTGENNIAAPKILAHQLQRKIQLFDNQLFIFRPT
jgi:diaminohydroxyphosphoribosylaminopyrimidine deaminase / 5-amino-6-(5-phosphoribosylamino)uracil reductase